MTCIICGKKWIDDGTQSEYGYCEKCIKENRGNKNE